ncbi:MAG TPA: hypothetical protein VD996_16790, partial [Chitinophagaceae bacterium]|nr:hypothetical protein [Chitinophagaceae bacterium]
MKNLIFLITLTVSGQALAQPTLQQLSRSTLPAGIRYSGNIKNAVSWTDSSGHHIVVTTETGAYESRNDVSGGSDAELFAYHYIKSGDSLKLTWKLYDHIKDCPVDIVAAFVKNTFAVTDLDKNGQAEI